MSFVISDAVVNMLYDAWDRHGEFGPAFVEVYERVTEARDRLGGILRSPYTADDVVGYAKEFSQSVQLGCYATRANAIIAMRRAGLSLHAIARLVDEPVNDIVHAAHNVKWAKKTPETFLLLDEMLIKGCFTNKEIVEATGLLSQTINRLSHLINRPTVGNQPRVTTPESLYEVRRLHFIEGMNKGLAIKQAQIDHPSLTRACGYAALRTPNGILDNESVAS